MLKLSDKNFKAVDTIMLNDISENMLAINEKKTECFIWEIENIKHGIFLKWEVIISEVKNSWDRLNSKI